jgi:GntR family transcriptional regulator/MocR family aminotransferase
MHLVLWLADGLDDKWVASKACEVQVSVRAVSPMYAGANGRPGLILGLGGFTAEEIESATRRLAHVITLAASGRQSRG